MFKFLLSKAERANQRPSFCNTETAKWVCLGVEVYVADSEKSVGFRPKTRRCSTVAPVSLSLCPLEKNKLEVKRCQQ
ncbi:hypothetical protein Q7C36_015989 [Tachysurus vachellii]|uniref:Uncharacterized protein n=1 Tax=Tachysurus vachellii TaxID=175792 RepID=A0AA88M7R4_TACVA|nr:hypothetical protein Q7C36_015989 [Tachysurus vachellii]